MTTQPQRPASNPIVILLPTLHRHRHISAILAPSGSQKASTAYSSQWARQREKTLEETILICILGLLFP